MSKGEENMGKKFMVYLKWFWRILVKPGDTFEEVQQKSDVVKPMLILIGIGLIFALIMLPKLQELTLWQLETAPPPNLTAEQLSSAKSMVGFTSALGVFAGTLAVTPLLWLIWTLAIKIAAQFLAWDADFKQIYKTAVFSSAVNIIRDFVYTLLFLITPPEGVKGISTSLTLLVNNPQNIWWYRLLAHIEAFTIWNLTLFSIGLSVLFGQKIKITVSVVFGLWLVYVIGAIIIGQIFGLPVQGV
jgi:hypothetical protein